jgi:hypothetical protein
MKKVLTIFFIVLGILFVIENLYFLFKPKKASQSPIFSANQLSLIIGNYYIEHNSGGVKSYPKTFNDLIKEKYITLKDINVLFPQGLWVYTPPSSNWTPNDVILTGYFSTGMLTSTVSGKIETKIYKKNAQQGAAANP